MAEEQNWPAARYRLRSEAYMPRMPHFDCEILAPGTEVVWAGRPGPHLEPLDDLARAAYAAAGADGMSLDPFACVPLTDAATDDDILAERIARAMGPAMISALGKLGFIKAAGQPATPASAMAPIPLATVPDVLPPPPPPPAPAPQAKRGK